MRRWWRRLRSNPPIFFMAYECLRHPVYIGCVLGSDACASAFSRSSPQFAELVHGKLWTVSVKVSSLGLWSSHSFAMLCHKMFSIKVAILGYLLGTRWSDHEHQLWSGRISWLCCVSIGGSFSKCGEMIIENFWTMLKHLITRLHSWLAISWMPGTRWIHLFEQWIVASIRPKHVKVMWEKHVPF